MLNQRLQQKLLQKLSPQQILLMKLLQIPSVALEQRIKQEIEENPVLEMDDAQKDPESYEPEDYEDTSNISNSDNINDVDISDYLDEDDLPSYRMNAGNYSPDEEYKEIPLSVGIGFHDHLISQLELKELTPHQHLLGKNIIGNLDEAGYLQRDIDAMVDDLAFSQGVTTTNAELKEVLAIIQTFDPPGVAARNLQECLVLQLNRFPQTDSVKLSILILERCFEDFTKKHYDKIIKRARINEDQLRDAISEILKLNPKPGSTFQDSSNFSQFVIPDFIIEINDGKLELTLNQRNMPELKLSKTYVDMMEAYSDNSKNKEPNITEKNAILFIKQKIDSARWFIEAIKQRQNTLMLTMQAIVDYQFQYFIEGDETLIRPMILKDIAEKVGLDISTISRVANSKYVQTPYGTFLLKSFFSESLQNEQGEEFSTREIKKILSNCIEAEEKSKPLTDQELTDVLKDKGYPIARRTVAKYREQLAIPVARLRKTI